jgi:hypothetical protein
MISVRPAGPDIGETTSKTPASQTTRANQEPGKASQAGDRRSHTGRVPHIGTCARSILAFRETTKMNDNAWALYVAETSVER